MRYALLISFLMLQSIGRAAVVQGTVINAGSSPVANQIVHVTDSSNGVQLFHLMDTTDAAGHYSMAVPSGTANGSLLHVYTEKCGVKHTSLPIYSGANITVNFTVCGTAPCTGDTVSGKVTLGSTATAAYPATVYLIRKSFSSTANAYVLTLLDTTLTAANGEFRFTCVTYPAGDLLVKAALTPANSSYWSYLPTYKENSLTWNNAHIASFTPGANNIHMVAGANSGGPGFIGGSVLQGANKSTGVGDPLGQRLILLTTIGDEGVGYVYSDAAGHFSFSNLAYGTYKLFGDAWGKDNPVSVVTIDANHPGAGNIVFEENAASFGVLGIGNLPAAFEAVKVFPNPVQSEISISGLSGIKGPKTISLYSVTGTVLQSQTAWGDRLTLPASQLASGCYLLQICTEAGTASYRIIR